jgi:hypothetical protein
MVILVAALECACQAATFRWDLHGKSDRALAAWREGPTPETEAAWKAALAERRQSEREWRMGFGAGAAVFAALGIGLLVSTSKRADVLGIANVQPRQIPAKTKSAAEQ